MHHALKDLTGLKFHKLQVISRAENYSNGMSRWLCRCDCGNTTIVASAHLRSKKRPIKSCGCSKTETTKKHGHAHKPIIHGFRAKGKTTRTYNSWRGMRDRCLNPNSDHYKDYGGRGISICDRWNSFELFLSDMGERPNNTTLDRVLVNGNYEPNNCRWSSQSDQVRNQRKKLAIENFSDEVIRKEFERRFGLGDSNGKEAPQV